MATLLFELYFDGGTERKLQVRHLNKSRCIVHATWGIQRMPLNPDAAEEFALS